MSEITIGKIDAYIEEVIKILKKKKVSKEIIEGVKTTMIIKAIQNNQEPKELVWEIINL